MTVPPYTLSEATIKAIGDDLIRQYLENDGWLFEALASLSEVIVGEDGFATPLFNKDKETFELRNQLKNHIASQFEKMIRNGQQQNRFVFW